MSCAAGAYAPRSSGGNKSAIGANFSCPVFPHGCPVHETRLRSCGRTSTPTRHARACHGYPRLPPPPLGPWMAGTQSGHDDLWLCRRYALIVFHSTKLNRTAVVFPRISSPSSLNRHEPCRSSRSAPRGAAEARMCQRRNARQPFRPAADGARHCPSGRRKWGPAMIDLYTWPTPNGHKISIMLEELGCEYRVHPIDIGNGEQFAPEYSRSTPTARSRRSSTKGRTARR